MRSLPLEARDLADIGRLLRRVKFFAAFTIGEIEQILPHITLYRAEAGETLVRQGEPGDTFFILKSGQVSVEVKDRWLHPARTVARLNPGDFFGEMALLSTHRRSATVTCTVASHFFVLRAADFRMAMRESPAFAEAMQDTARARRLFSGIPG